MVTIQQLERSNNLEDNKTALQTKLNAIVEPLDIVRFIGRYTSWNSIFPSAMSSLSAKISRTNDIFIDKDEPIKALNDRGIYIASHIFDAAKKEFNDNNFIGISPHRSLAQATMRGIIAFKDYKYHDINLKNNINEVLVEPLWLDSLKSLILRGYGLGQADTILVIFKSFGFHIGNKLLADQDFGLINDYLETSQPELVNYLKQFPFASVGHSFPGYAWIALHHGLEKSYANWALQGVNLALKYIDPSLHDDLHSQIINGYTNSIKLHKTFLDNV